MKTFANGLLANLVAAGMVGAGIYFYQKNKGKNPFGKSDAESKVDELYGPAQRWKNSPVYNTPGKPGYIPTLPPSYAPGTAPALTSVSANYIGPPPSLPVGSDNTTTDPFMFGLGDFRIPVLRSMGRGNVERSAFFRAPVNIAAPSFDTENRFSRFGFGRTGRSRNAATNRGFNYRSRIFAGRFGRKYFDEEMGGAFEVDGLGRMVVASSSRQRKAAAKIPGYASTKDGYSLIYPYSGTPEKQPF